MRTLAAIIVLAWTCSLGVESREQSLIAPRLRADRFEVAGTTFRTANLPGPTQVEASSDHVDITRGAVREHLEVRGAEVEQTWTWSERPREPGDVVVRVEVTGGRFVREDQRGLLLATATGSLRYSHGTLIDARGARTPVPATFSGGAIELRVPDRVLDAAAYPLVLDPTVGPEREVEPPDAGPPMFARTARALWNGTNYVVLTASGSSIASARVKTDGTILDVPARKLVDFGKPIGAFDVATAGGKTLIYATINDLTSAWGAFLSGDGTSTGAPFAIPGTPYAFDVRLAASATRFLAVTHSGLSPYPLLVTRLESDGTVIDTTPKPIAAGVRYPSIASDGTDWLVTYLDWASPERLTEVVVTNDGVVSSATPLMNVSGYPRVPVSVFSRSAGEYRIFSDRKIHRVSKSGAALGSVEFFPWGPILWDTPAATHVTWAEGSIIRDSTLDSSGAPTTPGGNVIGTASFASSGESELSVAVGASETLLSVSGHVGRFLPTSGTPLDTMLAPALIATRPQSLPAIASNGKDYFAAWFESVKGGSTIRGARMAPNATALDTANRIGAVHDEYGQSQLTFDGSSYFLARQLPGGISLDRFAPDRTLLGTSDLAGAYLTYGAGIASTSGITAVAGCPPCVVTLVDGTGAKLGSSSIDVPTVRAIAGGGGKFLIAWSDWEALRAVRMTTSGIVEDTTPLLLAKTNYPRDPRIAFTGSDFIVAYNEASGTGAIRLRHVSLGGAVSAAEIVLGEGQSPDLAVSGDRVVVVWQTTRLTSPGNGRIVAAMIPRDGSLGFTPPITVAEDVPTTWGPRVAASVDGAFMVLYPRVDHTGTPRVAATTLTFGKMLGGACGATADCEVGTCVDGVCCERACGGACEACDLAGSAGHCVPVSGDPHGARSCSGFACNAGMCRTTCAVNADCASSYSCVAGTCTPSRPTATACSRDDECSSGFCTDGVCCNARCDGICEACDVPGSVGSCAAATGRPHGERASCPAVASNVCSATLCDGVRRDTCAGFVGSEVICREGTCVGGSGTAEARCDGTGACPSPSECEAPIEEGGGCGCQTPARKDGAGGLITAIVLAALARRRRLQSWSRIVNKRPAKIPPMNAQPSPTRAHFGAS